jgi:hypothetical protein
MTRCQRLSCWLKALCEYGLEPSWLPAVPGNSHGLPAGQRSRTWSCCAAMAAAALALSGISCSARTLTASKRRQGQPLLPVSTGLNGRVHASPPRSPVSIMTTMRWRVVRCGIFAMASSDSSWAITYSGMNRAMSSWWKGSSST